MSADTTTKPKYIKMCQHALQCSIYAECREINRHNEECHRFGKDNEIKPLPKRVEQHMKNFKHIALPICKFHSKSREGSGCKHIHMEDLDDIKDKDGNVIRRGIKGNLCFYDMKCNNPHCHGYHGWKCPYGIGCKNKECPLVHPTLRDVNGKEIDDGRKHMPDQSYFINYPKKDDKKSEVPKKLKIERPADAEKAKEPAKEPEKEPVKSETKPTEKPTGKRGRKPSK